MRKPLKLMAPLAVAATTLLASPLTAAHAATGTTYQATLDPVNGSGGSGMLTLTVNGDRATVDESWSGLASSFNGSPYPHVQHIHIGADGVCPTMSADKDGDGVISTPEGQASYGMIGTTLSTKGSTSAKQGTNIKIAPAGPSTRYHRSFTLNSATREALSSGSGVIVVHGLDPSTLPAKAQKEKSPLVPSLPLAATAPALCGALSVMPAGGVATGNGSTAGTEDVALFALGAGLVGCGVGAAVFAARRRSVPTA